MSAISSRAAVDAFCAAKRECNRLYVLMMYGTADDGRECYQFIRDAQDLRRLAGICREQITKTDGLATFAHEGVRFYALDRS